MTHNHPATELLAPDAPGLARAAELLRAGRLVAFGTETVYGLGADATSDRAVAAIYAAKGRPRFNPLIAHYASAEAAFAHVVANDAARRLAARFWPGPLTLVLPRAPGCPLSLLAAAGLSTQAVRVPAAAPARALIEASSLPIAAPSANRSGRVSPTTAAHVLDGLAGRIAAVLDCGPCPVGVESSVLSLAGPRPVLLRPGGVAREAIEAVIGRVELPPAGLGPLTAPGMMASHYAPRLPVRLDARAVGAEEALLAFGPPLAGAGLVFQLSERGDAAEAAARLFTGLRSLDAEATARGLVAIAAMPVPGGGLAPAIRDRLRRAAAPRPAEGG